MTRTKKQACKCKLEPVHFFLGHGKLTKGDNNIPHTKGHGSIDSTMVSKREGPIKPMKLKTRGQVARIPFSGVTKILLKA
ncbi:hypothetical protein PanWU01x14_006930 [Parasponia andersonii]|uniref:Uncharacterized protein n=1 Tax=Parasponia andersonii TaxID=3476 RepID=A0A2P5E3Y0_PARAD|nr:hypothetical protein PanWU01x14_006930 [Parasponia andersonii]